MTDRPFPELPPVEASDFERAREAVAAIRGRGRGPDGRVLPGNTAAMRHGLYSTRLVEQPDVAAWHQQQVEAITADLGGDQELTALKRGAVREVARLELLVASLGEQLLQGGPLTSKGKMRAASTLYLQVLDRYMRLASTLGLDRRQRTVGLDAYLDAERRVDAPEGDR